MTTRNIGTSSRRAVMCGFAAGHIPRDLERREVASDGVSPWAFPEPLQQFLLAFVGVSDKAAPVSAPALPIGFLALRIRPENQRKSSPDGNGGIYPINAVVSRACSTTGRLLFKQLEVDDSANSKATA
jgi:hypothetical protein